MIRSEYRSEYKLTIRCAKTNKEYNQFHIDGVNYIGVKENESFKIEVSNNTYSRIEAKVSVDGTDVLSGKPASLDIAGDRFLINSHGNLSLSAWAESMEGGRSFVFTNENKSVATHTHGNKSSLGIIGVAIYTGEDVYKKSYTKNFLGERRYKSLSYNSSIGTKSSSYDTDVSSDISDVIGFDNNRESVVCSSSPAAVGAGEYTNQNLVKVEGLLNPKFQSILNIKYMWWDDLKKLLDNHRKIAKSPADSGFPGSDEFPNQKTLFSLDNVPVAGSNDNDKLRFI